MRAIWKGSVSFGMVNVPVRLYSATENHDIRFHQVHRKDGGRIRYKRTCSECGKEIDYDDIVKGYETSDGQLVQVTGEELDNLPLPTGHEIDVDEFVDANDVDPMLLDRSYFLEPDKRSLKAYVLLRRALEDSERMAIVKVALRKRETLAALHVRDNVIVLQTMRWPDEIRQADFDVLDGDVDLSSKEVKMANTLVESMAGDFDPTEYEDQYAQALEDLVETKIEGGDVTDVSESAEEEQRGDVIDLTSALQRSIDDSGSQKSSSQSSGSRKSSGKSSGSQSSGSKQASKKQTQKKQSSGSKKQTQSKSQKSSSGTKKQASKGNKKSA